jgi:regulatory protein
VRRAYSNAIAEKTLKKLRALNYVDDESFARNWASGRAGSLGFGPKRIEQELQTKGISQTLIRAAVRENFGQGDESAKAKALLEKNFRNQQLNDPKILRRAVGFLQRRGYSSKVIFDLLKQPLEDD